MKITFIDEIEEDAISDLSQRIQAKIERYSKKYDLVDIKFSTYSVNDQEWYCALLLFNDKDI